MRAGISRPVSGHVFRVDRKRGPVWFAKYRLPDGRQVQKKIGPAWTRRGRPAVGYLTKAMAQEWLDSTLAEARRGELAGMIRTDTTFAEAAAEWLVYVEQQRACKPRTVADYSMMVRILNQSFGDRRIEEFTPEGFEAWKIKFASERRLSNRTLQKYLVVLHSIFKRAMKVHGLPRNPMAVVERPRLARRAGIDVFSRDEVMALVANASNHQDGVLYLTAVFTGLRRGELLSLRWEDVDVGSATIRVRRSWSNGVEGTPKSGRGRAVPLMREVGDALQGLRERDRFVGDHDLVFCDPLGRHLGEKSFGLRYKASLRAAGLRELRFHDLRHTFGTHAIRAGDPREVMEWMGHADIQTTQKYLSYKPRRDAARRLAAAFDDEALAGS
jgi:integrase